MPVAIPRKRSYPLPRLDAEACQRVCHAARALREIPIRIAVNVPFDPSRHNFLRTMMAFGVHEQRSHQ
jgi:predicted choloylglycine hydrolase